MTRTLFGILLVLGPTCVLAQTTEIHQPHQNRVTAPHGGGESRILQASSPKALAIPFFASIGTRCDSNGNMYFATSNAFTSGALVSVSHDGSQTAVFVAPKPARLDPLGRVGFRDFTVAPSGQVYELLQNQNDEGIVVIKFEADGSVGRIVKPDVPDRLQARSLVVFDDGTLLLRGDIRLRPKESAARNYVALFDAAGKLRTELTGFPDLDFSAGSRSFHDAGNAVSQDGKAYVLGTGVIKVISEWGEPVRELSYEKPDPSLMVTDLMVSEGLIAITLVRDTGDDLIPSYQVLRANDASAVGYYTLPNESLNTPKMCFSRNDGFTFLIHRDDKLALVNAPLAF